MRINIPPLAEWGLLEAVSVGMLLGFALFGWIFAAVYLITAALGSHFVFPVLFGPPALAAIWHLGRKWVY